MDLPKIDTDAKIPKIDLCATTATPLRHLSHSIKVRHDPSLASRLFSINSFSTNNF